MTKIFEKFIASEGEDMSNLQLSRFLEYTFVAVDFVSDIMHSHGKEDWVTLERQAHSIKGRARCFLIFILVS